MFLTSAMTRFASDAQDYTGASIPIDHARASGHRPEAGRMALEATWGDRPLEVLRSVWVPGAVHPPHTGPIRDGELVQQIPACQYRYDCPFRDPVTKSMRSERVEGSGARPITAVWKKPVAVESIRKCRYGFEVRSTFAPGVKLPAIASRVGGLGVRRWAVCSKLAFCW